MSHLTRLAAQAGYAVHNGTAYGRTNGIYFNVVPDPDGHGVTVRTYIRPIETLTFRDTGRGRGIDLIRINEYLNVRKREYSNGLAEADERSLWLTLDGAPDAERISEFLYAFSKFLSDNGYVSSCAMCPQTRELGRHAQGGEILEICSRCADRLKGTLQDIASQPHIKDSYMRGAAGAVLGGIAGALLWILLNFIGNFSFLAGLPMAYFAHKGYRLMHGRRSRTMLLILFTVLLVFTYFAVMVCEGINVYRVRLDAGYTTGLFKEIGGMMTGLLHPDVYDLRLLWLRLGIGLVFSGLGGFALVLRFRRENTVDSRSVPTRSGHTLHR